MAITLNGTSGINTPNETVVGSLQAGGVAADIYALVPGTAVTASGTSVDFTGIPSWAKRVTVMFKGVSTDGSSPPLIQLGATTPVTTGYLGTGTSVSGSVGSTLYTTGFGVGAAASTSSFTRSGSFVISKLTDNNWTCQGAAGQSDSAQTLFSTGAVDVGATLDMIRITTVNGTDTFDAGTINIMYE